MLTRHEHLLLKLMEECAEVSQRASKLLQFGHSDVEPGHNVTNGRRFRNELNDLLTVIEMVEESRLSWPDSPEDLATHKRIKRDRIEHYFKYSASMNRVTENPQWGDPLIPERKP
jgi:hypothetical protein